MHDSPEEHIGLPPYECYSLRELASEALEGAECHLLICAACRDRLAGIEPFNTAHYTKFEKVQANQLVIIREGSPAVERAPWPGR